MAQKILTNTSHVISCIVILKDVIKVSLLQKGQNNRIKNIVSIFYGMQCSLNNCELSATIMTNSCADHNTSASKMVGLVHTLVHKTFHTLAVHTITSIAKTKWKSGFVTKKDVLPGVKPPSLARSPDYRSLLRTVWPAIQSLARPGVLAFITRFRRWICRIYPSWRCDVTCGLPRRGLPFVLNVSRRQIISFEIVILETLK